VAGARGNTGDVLTAALQAGKRIFGWRTGALLAGLGLAVAVGIVAMARPAAALSPEATSPGVASTRPGHPRALPKILSAQDVMLYRRIFALGEPGRWDEVDRLVAQLDDRLLLGHVLAQRYLHPTRYRTPFHELRDWMARYHDLPYARRIHKLALRRKPAGAGPVRRPSYGRADHGIGGGARRRAVGSIETLSTRAASTDARRILRQVRWNVLNTRLTITEAYLQEDEVAAALRPVEQDRGYAMVAAGWYYYGNDRKALTLARRAVRRSGDAVPGAYWIAGLAAWRLGDMKAATASFEALAQSDGISGGAVAAGAYWAARAHLRLRQPARMSRWLRKAAAHPRTFYGLLAHEALGMAPPMGFDDATVRTGDLDGLLQVPAVRRALALLQVGEQARARRELLGVEGWADPERVGALLLIAERGGMPAFAFRLASRLAGGAEPEWSRSAVNAALYPIPPWRPATGFRIDRALLFAMMRQESGFRPDATSPAGARGLMQLMPATASFMARRENVRYSRRALYRPDLNLDLAQRYVDHLLSDGAVAGKLIHLAAAYNGGPGNLRKWLRETDHHDDPLLFVESIPSRETRLFIERVLTNLWIYRARLGQPAPSRRAIAAGDWPVYVPLDRNPQKVARK